MLRHCAAAIAVILPISAIGAQAVPAPPPPSGEAARLIGAFNDTCRRGFPDLQAIRSRAVAGGWTELAVRPISEPKGRAMPVPRVLRKEGVTLALTGPYPFGAREACSVSLNVAKATTEETLATAVSQALGSAIPEIVTEKRSRRVEWSVNARMKVRLSVQKKPPMAHLVVASGS